jgi:hypothetical protein
MMVNSSRKWWICKKCKNKLGKIVEENEMELLLTNGQKIDVCFASIDLYCNKCGEHNRLTSSLYRSEEKLEYAGHMQFSNPIKVYPFKLGSYYKKILLGKLSKKEKIIYKQLEIMEKTFFDNELPSTDPNFLETICDDANIPEDIAIKHIKKIQEQIELITGKNVFKE